MLATSRYYFAQLGESQRYLPPVIAYVALLATLYTEPKEALHVEYAVSVAALVVCSCWLTIALVSVEDAVQRLITLSHARSWRPIVAGLMPTVLLTSGGLTILSLAWSLLVHRTPPQLRTVPSAPVQHSGSGAELVLGALSHLSAVLTGIAIGLSCSRLLLLLVISGCTVGLLARRRS